MGDQRKVEAGREFLCKPSLELNLDEQELVTKKIVTGKVKENRKPSERFLRRPLKARSRVSSSERKLLADLKEKLADKIDTKSVNNVHAQFGDYKPGHNGSLFL
jgi:hypothetical protein